jgi:hypothetical protein
VTNVQNNTTGVSTEGSNAKPSPELTMYLHDFFGPNRDAKVIPATQTRNDGLTYKTMAPAFSPDVRVAEVNAPFPDNPIKPADKLPPATVITFPPAGMTAPADRNGRLVVRGTCIDASRITAVTVNGITATAKAENFSQWEVALPNLPAGEVTLTAKAVDELGNQEKTPHVMTIRVERASAVAEASNTNGAVREYELAPNYPNPFNPETQIAFAIPAGAAPTQRLQLAIFDVLGRQVRLLADDDLPPGRYTQTWDGRNDAGSLAPSGIYFYRMTVKAGNGAARFQQIRKMAMTR